MLTGGNLSMAILPVAIYPEPILSQVAEPVATVTNSIRQLLNDMAETMYAAPGVGLAGPQVHVRKRVIVVDAGKPTLMRMDDAREPFSRVADLYQLVNPVIVAQEGSIAWEEGCLSLPEFHSVKTRAACVTIEALDLHGQPITVHGEGLLAVVLQHEIDHLDGTLIIDDLSRLKRNLYIDRLRKLQQSEM